jgi:hypothetical protein
MADAPKPDFGKRRQVSVPPNGAKPPAKRSHEVVLLVMGTIAVGSTAYALMPRECAPAQPGMSSPAECSSRSSSSSSGGGSRYSYYSGSSSSSTAATTPDASSGGVKRGGFGAFARSFSSHFSFGG